MSGTRPKLTARILAPLAVMGAAIAAELLWSLVCALFAIPDLVQQRVYTGIMVVWGVSALLTRLPPGNLWDRWGEAVIKLVGAANLAAAVVRMRR